MLNLAPPLPDGIVEMADSGPASLACYGCVDVVCGDVGLVADDPVVTLWNSKMKVMFLIRDILLQHSYQ